MITEDYCDFEAAKLLKEKGFDEPCKAWYAEYTSVWGGDSSGDRKYIKLQFDDKNRVDESYKFLCYAPTLQMAMKWLREVYKIDIAIYPYGDYSSENYQFDVYENRHLMVSKDDGYMTYEQACEAAIKYCLENLV